MNENEKLKEFWDNAFKGMQGAKIEGKWVADSSFNDVIGKYVKDGSTVLDYGCGSGWALIEVGYTVNLKHGVGIDPSKNVYEGLIQTKTINGFNNLDFLVGDQNSLDEYNDYFDNIISFNVIDVIPDDVVDDILVKLKKVIKKDEYLLLAINPDLPCEILEKNGFERIGNYLFKDGILRSNVKSKDEWIDLFEKYYDFVEYVEFALTEREKQFPRRMFILKNKVSQ